jgi:hypothetical protein
MASNGCINDGINGIVMIGTNFQAATNHSPGLQIGNGVGAPSGNGDGIGIAAYIQTPGNPVSTGIVTASAFNSPYSDYGEYFEWEDGNHLSEDRRGLFVTFSDVYPEKIRFAKPTDAVLGIVTQTSAVIGNSAELAWNGSVERDKFNQPIKVYNRLYDLQQFCTTLKIDTNNKTEEDIVNILKSNGKYWGDFNDSTRDKPLVLKTSNSYNPNNIYIPRSQRLEWSCVGLLGCLIVLEDTPGSCRPGKFVDCSNNSKAIAGNSYKVLKRISSDTIMIFFRG